MAPERIAGRYRVERAAGRGGMGTVWLCTDEVLGRQVAVKQVGTLPGESTLYLARALREARSSAALNHRNVVAIYDAVEEGDHIWLVMEYVPGQTLAEIVKRDGPLSPERAARLGAQVADGLAAAHARGTIHRDVKPGNILVTHEDLAKISDFGIARTQGDTQITQSGMLTGTPAYFAPELARGDDPTPAADVWALGATLYAAVEGRAPYPEQANALAMLSLIASGPPPRPERAAFLTEPIVRALDPDPRSRWSITDLAHVLHRLEQRHATRTTRPITAAFSTPAAGGPTTVTGGSGRDDAQVPLGPDTVGGSSDDGTGPAAGPLRTAGRHHDDEGDLDRGGNRHGRLLVIGLVAMLVLSAVGGYLLLRDVDADPTADDATTPTAQASPSQPAPSQEAEDSRGQEEPTSDADQRDPSPRESSVSGSDAETFVSSYYAALPADTQAGWSSLSPAFQEEIGSYASYRGFWQSLADVEVTGAQPAGSGAVDVSLTYTRSDGGSEDEVRRIFVEQSGDGFVITGDEVVG
jgi:serine/threonine protein kinase